MAAKLTPQDLLAAADELGPEEQRELVNGMRGLGLAPDATNEAEPTEDEILAEAAMESTVRMLDSSRNVLDRVLGAAARVNDELAQGWF